MTTHQLKTQLHDYLEKHRPDGKHPNHAMEAREEAVIRAATPKDLTDKTEVSSQCIKFIEDAFENGAGIKLYDRIMQDMENRRPSGISPSHIHGREASNGYRYSSLVLDAKDPYDSENLAAYLRHTHQMIESPLHDAHDFQIGDIVFFKKHGAPKVEHVALVRGIDHNGHPEIAESTALEISYPSWRTFERKINSQELQLVGVGRLHELSQSYEQSQRNAPTPLPSHDVPSGGASRRRNHKGAQTSRLKASPTVQRSHHQHLGFPYTQEIADAVNIIKCENLELWSFVGAPTLTVKQDGSKTEHLRLALTGRISMDENYIYHHGSKGEIAVLDRIEVLALAKNPERMNTALNRAHTSQQQVAMSFAKGAISLSLAASKDRGLDSSFGSF